MSELLRYEHLQFTKVENENRNDEGRRLSLSDENGEEEELPNITVAPLLQLQLKA